MLGKLINTLKTKTPRKNTNQSIVKDKKEEQLYKEKLKNINQYKLDTQLSSEDKCLVKGPIGTIRYFVLPGLPNIIQQVINCPISEFHNLPHSQRRVKEIDLLKHPYPPYLQFLKPLLAKQLPSYNHLLINDYPSGVGIMPHTDGPAYKPKVVVLSIGSNALISFQKNYTSSDEYSEYQSRILLQQNSVHIFQHRAYTQYLHGILNYVWDSILIYYDKDIKSVIKSTVDNYYFLDCRSCIEELIQKGTDYEQKDNIVMLKLQNNNEYTHKIQIKRQRRVSITIRQKLYKNQINA